MPNPLYLAVNWKEIVNNPPQRLAQGGYGVREEGTARLPERHLSGAMRIVDDAVLPTTEVTEEALDRLAALCADGCCLDFERPLCAMQLSLIDGLRKRLGRGALLALPERFAPYAPEALPVVSCPTPCNCWRDFARQAHARHRQGWMLELTPWSLHIPVRDTKSQRGELPAALCSYVHSDGMLHYFDTRESIRAKLAVAEIFGCRAAIGILRELRELS